MGCDGNLGLKPQAVMERAFVAGWDLGAGCNVAGKWDVATSDDDMPGHLLPNPHLRKSDTWTAFAAA